MNVTPPRHLHFDSMPNVRELGGYAIAGGRRLRRGLLWRAGSPRDLTEKDACVLASLRIEVFFDFRTDEELSAESEGWGTRNLRQSLPGALIRHGIRWVRAPIASDPFAVPFPTSEDYTRAYVAMLDTSGPALGALLAALRSSDRPLMFGCTLGKDRTGVVSALLLLALGAPPEAIAADYAASACCLGRHAHRLQWLADQKKVSLAELTRRTRIEARTILAFLEGFARARGDISHYLASCGVDSGLVEAVRARVSEPSPAP